MCISEKNPKDFESSVAIWLSQLCPVFWGKDKYMWLLSGSLKQTLDQGWNIIVKAKYIHRWDLVA
jgi:hypothetical protein